jgi:Zn ribbon nucleic-acid-binding protein
LPQNIPLGLFGESKLKKQLLKSVDENIRRDFSERLSTSGANCPGACYHLIKTKITLMYTRNKIDGVECVSGTCLCRYGVVTINESLWKKYDGLYDFTKITYQKYIDVFRSPRKNKQLANGFRAGFTG